MTSPGPSPDRPLSDDLLAALPEGWSATAPGPADAPGLAGLQRRHEEHARGWASSGEEDVLIAVSARGYLTRQNVMLRDAAGEPRAWASAHDRAAGRMLYALVVDPALDTATADTVAEVLLAWAEQAARRTGASRELEVQQIDAGAFADDTRQQGWFTRAGFTLVRTWWQMSRPVTPEEADLDSDAKEGVRIRRVERQGTGMPSEDDLRIVHDVLESAFADHFNSHEETFDEFVSRLREDPGHRWDHWWIAELVPAGAEDAGAGVADVADGVPATPAEPAGAVVGAVSEGEGGKPDGSYVEYIGVLSNARGRGVAKSLLATVIADAAARGRDRVGLEVDADSPTGADSLYTSMGWRTVYITQSWHKDVPVR